MNESELVVKTAEVIQAKADLVKTFKSMLDALKDQTIPLDARWTALVALTNAGVIDNCDPFGNGYINVLGDGVTLYDTFNIDRYQTSTFVDMFEHIVDSDEPFENVDNWRETVLQSGYSEFTYDW